VGEDVNLLLPSAISNTIESLLFQVAAARFTHYRHLFGKITAPVTNQQMQPQRNFFTKRHFSI
jgi:hypothetical protein